MNVYCHIIEKATKKQKQIAVLIDPDGLEISKIVHLADTIEKNAVDYVFLGGSIIRNDCLKECTKILKEHTSIPVVIFPGSYYQIVDNADAILFLSLISGRNPEYLIGQHVVAAPMLKKTKLEVIPTGYMLVESNSLTTVQYMSHSLPIPVNKPDVAICTAMAGEMLGLKIIYMDGGSGALHTIPTGIIEKVKSSINIPLIVGGGIDSKEKAKESFEAGADLIVLGSIIENNVNMLPVFTELKNF